MAVQPNQPQGIGGVLDTAFQLYKSSFARVWAIALLTALMSLAPTLYWLLFGLKGFDVSTLASNPFAMYTHSPSLVGMSLLSVLLTLWGMGALVLKQRAIGSDEQMSTGEAFQAALSRVPALIVAMILYLFAFVAGSFLLVVPGLILGLSLIMFMALVLFDRKGPIDALIGSHKLVWGNWWRTCAVVTLAFILMVVIFMAVGIVAAVITPFAGMASGDFLVVTMVVQSVLSAAANVFMTPFTSAVMIALYWDLKLRKEGGDLAARVDALSAA
jgi:hypothetical protein